MKSPRRRAATSTRAVDCAPGPYEIIIALLALLFALHQPVVAASKPRAIDLPSAPAFTRMRSAGFYRYRSRFTGRVAIFYARLMAKRRVSKASCPV